MLLFSLVDAEAPYRPKLRRQSTACPRQRTCDQNPAELAGLLWGHLSNPPQIRAQLISSLCLAFFFFPSLKTHGQDPSCTRSTFPHSPPPPRGAGGHGACPGGGDGVALRSPKANSVPPPCFGALSSESTGQATRQHIHSSTPSTLPTRAQARSLDTSAAGISVGGW